MAVSMRPEIEFVFRNVLFVLEIAAVNDSVFL